MAGGVEVFVVFWKEWGIQALVLLSLALQVILLVSAEICHRKNSAVLRVIVWSAYLLADTTVIYSLGHMSVNSSKWLPEHQLLAFWALFLLLHLGGQDNKTAYSIEDNRLWLRHLQTLVVQVLAAGYVLYESSIVAQRTLLRPAAILMFVVGFFKYGERVWALNCASSSNLSRKNYQSFGRVRIGSSLMSLPLHNPQGQVHMAHQLLSFPMHLLKGPLPLVAVETGFLHRSVWPRMYQLVEVQLSLMYDVFYSKAPVIHTWYGRCVRIISPMATVAAFLLFHQFSQNDGEHYNRVDVAATYVLLIGAVVLEITSLLGAMFSSWTEAGVAPLDPCGDGVISDYTCFFRCLIWFVVILFRHLVKWAMRKAGLSIRHWSGSMGQHNFIRLCTQSRNNRSSKIARWMGREDWWNTLVYTSSIPVPPNFSELLMEQLLQEVEVGEESPDHISNSHGLAALKRKVISQEELACWSVGVQLDESILVWHIATHVYLSWYDTTYSPRPALATTIEVLSNYMIFLLAAHPYMLPDNASRQRYVELCNKVINNLEYNSAEDLVRLIREHGQALNTNGPPPPETSEVLVNNLTYDRACQLGEKLIGKALDTPAAAAEMTDLIARVWVEMLCYTSYRCRPDSHARRLSNGGEITTIVAILMEYTRLDFFQGHGIHRILASMVYAGRRSETPAFFFNSVLFRKSYWTSM